MPGADPMAPAPARIARVARETHDTFTLDVAPPGGASFAPGQFSMLYAFGVGEAPISISGDPSDRRRLTYTVRAVGAVTKALVGGAREDTIGVRGPFGAGWPMEAARGRDLLLVAGGIGLAPLRPVVYQVLKRRADHGRLTILYGARSPKDLLYRKELAAWARAGDAQVLVTVDCADLGWRGDVGVVTALFRRLRFQPGRTVAMVCGPEVMMRYVAAELAARGLAPGDLYMSLERNMKCAVGFCGHCQFGPFFVCKDGPVFPFTRIEPWIAKHEI